MSTVNGSEHPHRPRPSAARDPLRMTEAEKRMAEWEARHDVAARGHRASPDVVQHHLAHERLTHGEPASAVPRPRPPAPEEEGASGTVRPAGRTRGLLRRLFRRRA